MTDYKYLGITWLKSYKMLRIGRLYIEWWRQSQWGVHPGRNFFALHIGRLALAWSRFKCL